MNSAVLDVVVGMMFCYASVAIVASYLYEMGASFLGLRAKTLFAGVKMMLNDPTLQGSVVPIFNSGLVNPRHDGRTPPGQRPKILPSYIEPKAFATALIDNLQGAPEEAAQLGKKIAGIQDPQLRQLLQGMYDRARGEAGRMSAELANWFDSGMQRVSGAYKRRAQLYTFLIGLVLAVALNIDTFNLFQILWNHPSLLAQATSSSAQVDVAAAAKSLASLPVGWTDGFSISVTACFGWLLTASSTLFGAPFWFDLLRRVSNIRGAGQRPTDTRGADSRAPATSAHPERLAV